MERQGIAESGFTLLELMITVVIVGMLAAIVIPNLIAMRERDLRGKTKFNMHTVQLAVDAFGVENGGVYPTRLEQSAASGHTLISLLRGTLLMNPYSGRATEPRLGLAAANALADSSWRPSTSEAPAGSVWYTPVPDSTGRFTRYRIDGYDRSGPIGLVLISNQ